MYVVEDHGIQPNVENKMSHGFHQDSMAPTKHGKWNPFPWNSNLDSISIMEFYSTGFHGVQPNITLGRAKGSSGGEQMAVESIKGGSVLLRSHGR